MHRCGRLKHSSEDNIFTEIISKKLSPESHRDSRIPNATRTQEHEINPESIGGDLYLVSETITLSYTYLFRDPNYCTLIGNPDIVTLISRMCNEINTNCV